MSMVTVEQAREIGKWKMETRNQEFEAGGLNAGGWALGLSWGLALLPSDGQKAGADGCRKGSAPDPGEAYVKLAEGGAEVNGHSEAVPHGKGMAGSGHVGGKVMDAPCQDRPDAYDGEEKRQSEHKEHIAKRNHVRRSGRPGTG
jgi:hypothetical protein